MSESGSEALDSIYRHAYAKALERYKIGISVAQWTELSANVRDGHSTKIRRGWRGREIHVVQKWGVRFRVIYDPDTERIITFYPSPEFTAARRFRWQYRERTGHDPLPAMKQPEGHKTWAEVRRPKPLAMQPVSDAPKPTMPMDGNYGMGIADIATKAFSADDLNSTHDKLDPLYNGSTPELQWGEGATTERGKDDMNETQASSTTTPASMFQRAEKRQGWLRVGFTGPSGSGKTYSALATGAGICAEIFKSQNRDAKMAVIDTENNSAADYADRFAFDYVTIDPDYTIAKYRAAIAAAVEGKYDVLVIDSISHAWAGEGGLLNQKEKLDSRGGNSFANWAKITPLQEQFKAAMLHSKIHLIITMRSKQDYVQEKNDKGKLAPVKVGLAPIQREGMEYEFGVVFDLAMNHTAKASKDRTGMFGEDIFMPTADLGGKLLGWRLGGKAEIEAPSVPMIKDSLPVDGSGDTQPGQKAAPRLATATAQNGGTQQVADAADKNVMLELNAMLKDHGTTLSKEAALRGWVGRPITTAECDVIRTNSDGKGKVAMGAKS